MMHWSLESSQRPARSSSGMSNQAVGAGLPYEIGGWPCSLSQREPRKPAKAASSRTLALDPDRGRGLFRALVFLFGERVDALRQQLGLAHDLLVDHEDRLVGALRELVEQVEQHVLEDRAQRAHASLALDGELGDHLEGAGRERELLAVHGEERFELLDERVARLGQDA